MVQKVEMIVERFDNGITIQWSDVDGNVDSTKTVVPEGSEGLSLGNEIWPDIYEYFDKKVAGKVLVKIEYQSI